MELLVQIAGLLRQLAREADTKTLPKLIVDNRTYDWIRHRYTDHLTMQLHVDAPKGVNVYGIKVEVE